ncbi:glycosyltransferase family 4 protein [Chitinasiproducens palmae]|nr:glycosyltransferase family 4 protein [Chitinasiproducens palmae]
MNAIADEVWADSRATLDAILGKNSDKACRVISFLTARLQPASGQLRAPVHFVFWGRLAPQKAIDRAIAFFAKIRARYDDASFTIIGPDGGEKAKLVALVEQLAVADAVRFAGPAGHDELPEKAEGCAFFLQLSRHEGMAMSVIEAMQLGLVPIVTPVGEIPSYCKDGWNSLLMRDDEALGRVFRLIDEPALYNEIRRNALSTWTGQPLYTDEIFQSAREAFRRNSTCRPNT